MGEHRDNTSASNKPESSIPLRRFLAPLIILASLSTVAGFQVARLKTAWLKWQSVAPVQAAAASGSPAPMSGARKAEYEELSHLSPQQQAEHFLDRALHQHAESLDLIPQYVDGWRGRLQETDRLFGLVLSALKSDDQSVRTAAVEIDLAANNLKKSPDSVARLLQQIRKEPANRSLALWRLGALGNRGVEPQTVLAHLLVYARDRNEKTRYWAVEGLAMLGTDAAIDPLLDRFAHDPSPLVRERAAVGIAESGMLTHEQRFGAVPDLLNFLDDDALDSDTRGWVYGALRLITGEALGNNAQAWQQWWAHHDSIKKSRSPKGVIFA